MVMVLLIVLLIVYINQRRFSRVVRTIVSPIHCPLTAGPEAKKAEERWLIGRYSRVGCMITSYFYNVVPIKQTLVRACYTLLVGLALVVHRFTNIFHQWNEL